MESLSPPDRPKPLFTVDDRGDELVISWRWRSCAVIPLAIFGTFWNGIVLSFYVAALRSGDYWAMAFPSLHLAVGLGIAYLCLAMLVNRTTIEIGLDHLRVRHGPLPWPKQRDLRATDVVQLHCRERIHRSKSTTSYTYELHADVRGLSGDERLSLLTGLDSKEHARELEKLIEKHLGIRDKPVEGELPR
jgi:hypothetical protein